MEIQEFIKPLGIATFVFLLTTVISGLFRWKLKYHRYIAFTALTLAVIHALLVVFSD